MAKSWNGEVLTIDLGNDNREIFDCSRLPASIYVSCASAKHGIAQKLGDAKSGATPAERIAEAREVWDGLVDGNWNRKSGSDGIDLMPRAFEILASEATKKGAKVPKDAASKWLDAYRQLTAEKQAEARKKPGVKAAIETARNEKRLGAIGADGEVFTPF